MWCSFVYIGVLTKQMGLENGLVHMLEAHMPKGTAEGFGNLISAANVGTFTDHQLVYASHVDEYNKRLKAQPSANVAIVPVVPQPLDAGQAHFKKVASAQYSRDAYLIQHDLNAEWKKQFIYSRGKMRSLVV